MKTAWHRSSALLVALAAVASSASHAVAADGDRLLAETQVNVVTIHPHNTSAFTEGFFFMDNTVVESTGLRHHSYIRQYRLNSPSNLEATPAPKATTSDDDSDDDKGGDDKDKDDDDDGAPSASKVAGGKVIKEFKFDPEIFGEGIATIGDKIFALTYKQNKVLVISKDTFELVGTHPIHTSTGEGWGMTTANHELIVSDGSSSIQFFDPQQNFKKVRSIEVKLDNGEAVDRINELEFVEGEILANVWFKNHILRIDPADGHVIEVIDLSWLPGMVPNLQNMDDSHMKGEAVMNGIGYNPKNRHVYVTGKLWDSIFELELSYLKHARAQA